MVVKPSEEKTSWEMHCLLSTLSRNMKTAVKQYLGFQTHYISHCILIHMQKSCMSAVHWSTTYKKMYIIMLIMVTVHQSSFVHDWCFWTGMVLKTSIKHQQTVQVSQPYSQKYIILFCLTLAEARVNHGKAANSH